MRRGRRVMIASLMALLVAGLAGPGGAQAPRGEPPKLGLIDMYSGGFAAQAAAIRSGFEIAVDEANAAGGAAGRPSP